MPYHESGCAASLAPSVACGAAFSRCANCATEAATTHRPSHRPKATISDHRPSTNGSTSAATTETPSAQRRRTHRSGSAARFQLATGPIAMRKTAGAISGKNTASKYGGPTEILPRLSASRNSG